MYSKKKIFILIFLGFISSILLSNYYVTKYDKYHHNGYGHVMIKDETLRIWHQGAKIVEDVKEGKNFFLSGDTLFSKPLPERLVAIYSLLTGHKIIEQWEPNIKIKLGGKLTFLIIQSTLYYLALVYLVFAISKIFPLKNCFYIIFFLAFEHTIFQYHSSFWSESFYFTLQIILLVFLLKNFHRIYDSFLVGCLVGLMFLQRSAAIFYLIPIIIYFIFLYKEKSIKPIFFSIIGYSLIILLLTIFNYHKTKVFYFFPSEGKRDVYNYFSIDVLAEKEGLSISEVSKKEIQEIYKWLNDNNFKLNDINDKGKKLDLNKFTSPLQFVEIIKYQNDRIKFYNYINNRQYKILLDNPLITIKKTITKVLHFCVLEPTHVYYNNEHRGLGKKPTFHKSIIHKKWIPYRIGYTLLIYFICLFGLIYFFKQKNYNLLILLTLSLLYYVIILGWSGMTRLFVPNLIYLSFFFGNGLVELTNYFKNSKKSIL